MYCTTLFIFYYCTAKCPLEHFALDCAVCTTALFIGMYTAVVHWTPTPQQPALPITSTVLGKQEGTGGLIWPDIA